MSFPRRRDYADHWWDAFILATTLMRKLVMDGSTPAGGDLAGRSSLTVEYRRAAVLIASTTIQAMTHACSFRPSERRRMGCTPLRFDRAADERYYGAAVRRPYAHQQVTSVKKVGAA